MSGKLLFVQLLVAAVSGQDLAVSSKLDALPSLDLVAQASAVSLVLATSPAAAALRETSVELAPTPAAPTPAVMNGQEGDLAGPKMRQNLFHHGGVRPPHDAYARIEYDIEPCARDWRREPRPAPIEVPPPCVRGPVRDPRDALLPLPPLERGRGPAIPEPNREHVPYVRVTPKLVVQPHTHTHIETSTATDFDVSTQLRTRTITEQIYSTATHIFHPEHTFTIVDHHTYLEYPGSTIDPANVRGPLRTAAWGDYECHDP